MPKLLIFSYIRFKVDIGVLFERLNGVLISSLFQICREVNIRFQKLMMILRLNSDFGINMLVLMFAFLHKNVDRDLT